MLYRIKKRIWLLSIFMIFVNISYSQNSECIDSTLIDSMGIKSTCIQHVGYVKSFYSPVCGCDSVTYSSSSCAYYHGVKNYTYEPCRCIEPTFIDSTKNIIYYIKELPYGYTDPVLGCDGNYYPSPAMAILYGGVTTFTRDSFPCIVPSYIDTTIDLSSYRDDPVCGCDKKTYRNKYEAFFYGGNISWKNHKCNCIDEDDIDTTITCPDVYEPVCGCDRVTYQNQCIAENHYGVQYTEPGECPCIDSTLISSDSVLLYDDYNFLLNRYWPVCGCDSITYYNHLIAQYVFGIAHWTEGPCKCVDESAIDLAVQCPKIYYPVLGCDGVLYQNPCIARFKHGVMQYGIAPCYIDQQIDTTIECNPHFNYDPVCGCDTVTYPNECYAKYHVGLTKWYYGPCLNDSTCIDTFLINTLKYCSDQYDPVCGCDSITYTNECVAKYRYGIKKWRQGKCTTSNYNVENTFEDNIIVYPNPFVNKINLLFSIENLPEYIRIFDMYGRKIYQNHYFDKSINKSILLNNIQPGIYLIELKTKKGTYLKKVIKM